MKYDVKFSCGHEGVIDLWGKQAERDREIYKAEHYGCCPECQARKKEEENKKNTELAKEMQLPVLEGSEKQIAWAENIRMKFVKKYEQLKNKVVQALEEKGEQYIIDSIANYKNNGQASFADTLELMFNIVTNNSAKWIIDNRTEFYVCS